MVNKNELLEAFNVVAYADETTSHEDVLAAARVINDVMNLETPINRMTAEMARNDIAERACDELNHYQDNSSAVFELWMMDDFTAPHNIEKLRLIDAATDVQYHEDFIEMTA